VRALIQSVYSLFLSRPAQRAAATLTELYRRPEKQKAQTDAPPDPAPADAARDAGAPGKALSAVAEKPPGRDVVGPEGETARLVCTTVLILAFLGFTVLVLSLALSKVGFWVTFGLSWFVIPALFAGFQELLAKLLPDRRKKAGGGVEQSLGLSPREEAIRRVLQQFGPNDYTHVLPEIPADALAKARAACGVPPEERILGLLDVTDYEYHDEAASNLLVGGGGVYFHVAKGSTQPGSGTIPYAEFAGRAFVNHGDWVYLGKDQYLALNPEGCYVEGETIAGLLNALRPVVQVGTAA
jgi:hypothetical protein